MQRKQKKIVRSDPGDGIHQTNVIAPHKTPQNPSGPLMM